MAYFKPQNLTAFHKSKVSEIAKLVKEGINPLKVIRLDGGKGYSYTIEDMRNYYESIEKEFDLIVG